MEAVLAESLKALEQGEGLEAVLARYPEQAVELKALLEMAAWMGAARAAVEPRPGYVRASRARLLERIGQAGAAAPVSWWERLGGMFVGRRYATQLAVVVVMLACLVLGSSGIAYASQGTLPGDTLYPVKLGLEQAELLVNQDPVDEVRLHLQFSQNRLDEIEQLVKLGRYQDLQTALTAYSHHIDQAVLSLEELAAIDPGAASELAAAMKPAYDDQAAFLALLLGQAGAFVRDVFEQAIADAEEGAGEVERVGDEIESLPQPTATDDPPAARPTPTHSPATPTPLPPENKGEGTTGGASATPLATQSTVTSTPTSMLTARATLTRTAVPTHDSTARPAATNTLAATLLPTATSRPTNTPVPPPTSTQPPPTNTSVPPPTSTQPPPTSTPRPTNTPVPPPTNTQPPPPQPPAHPQPPPPTEPPPPSCPAHAYPDL
jgi:hypothetical protein